MSERFFVAGPLTLGPISLHGPEAHHLATVCRAEPGSRVVLFNGDGSDYDAEVLGVGKKVVSLQVIAASPAGRELAFRLVVAAPLPKGDRADFLVEKLTELGVTEFWPLHTQRSVVVARGQRLEKLRRVVIEASKQCGRSVLLDVRSPSEWADFIGHGDLPAERCLAHVLPVGERTRPPTPTPGVVLAVGPEGGFTEEEVSAAISAGWRTVGLGPRVLRVETAALTLAALVTLGAEG